MIRVVIGTNVLVSSLVNHATPPSKVIEFFHKRVIDVIFSRALVDAYRRVLLRPSVMALHKRSVEEIIELLTMLEKQSTEVFPLFRLDVVKLDPTDNMIIEAAVVGGVEFIVSGDKHLLALDSYEGIQIVTPALFVAYLEQVIG